MTRLSDTAGFPVVSFAEKAPAEKALAESLRALVRDELQDCGLAHNSENKSHDLRPLQVVFLVAFVLDVTILYLMVLAGNEVWDFLGKLLPALGGTLAVSYFDRLRGWLFSRSGSLWLGIPSSALLILLLMLEAPIYSALVQPDPPGLVLEVDGKRPNYFQDDTHTFLRGLKLQSHRISVQLGSNPKFEYQIDEGSVLKGTLARLPLLNRVNFMPVTLVSAYEVTIDVTSEHTPAKLYVSAPPELPLESSGFTPWSPKRAPRNACPPQLKCWIMLLPTMATPITLPGGRYTFVEADDECTRKPKTKTITVGEQDVELPKECDT